MDMRVYFPGGKKVFADFNKFIHKTDQPTFAGGEGTAPSPFELFLASLGTCAGLYALNFCEKRKIDTAKLKLELEFKTHKKTHMVEKVRLKLTLPPDFPQKYKPAIIKAVDLCYVKKHLHEPPEFETITQSAV